MEDAVCLNKSLFIKQISETSYFVFNSFNKKSYEIGNVEAETMLTMQNEINFDNLCVKNDHRMTAAQLKSFTEVLDKLGFLKTSNVKRSNRITRIKLGIFNPSKHLDQTSLLVRLMHAFLLTAPWLVLFFGIFSLYISHSNILLLLSTYNLSFSNTLLVVAIILITTVLHEMAHMCFAIYYGAPVPEIGLMFYWFAPCAYADVSAIHFLKNKTHKIQVLLAGIYVHMLFTGIGLLGFRFFPQLINYTLPVIIINLSMILLNITFYLKLDGYHILTIVLDDPQLRERSIGFALSKKFRSENRTAMSFNKILSYIISAFVSLIYIPALISSLALRFGTMLVHIVQSWIF